MPKKIRDLNPFKKLNFKSKDSNLLYVEYKNLLLNALKVERTDGENLNYNVETLIKDSLIENSSVGYDKITDKWSWVYGEGLNELGNPTKLNFVLRNGISFVRNAFYEPSKIGAYKINAFQDKYSIAEIIKKTTDFMANCNIAIKQNIEACKTPYIIVSKNKDLQLSIEQAIQEKEQGQAVIVVSEELGEALQSVNIKTDYIADKFLEIRDKERDLLLNKLGIMSANINKRERVQVGEVNATLGQCFDYIYLFIDNFNAQMKTYDLPFKMSLNGSLEELYSNLNETNDIQTNNENEGGQEK